MTEDEIIASSLVPGWPSVYVIGSFDSRITFFSQQVRGFNLAYALRETGNLVGHLRIAVIGAGAAGLSAASGLALLTSHTTIDVFERDKFPLHLQRGCTRRNLHPHIYDWPNDTANDSNAGLPYLNWSANSASEVAKEVIFQFDTLCARLPERIKLRTLHDVLEISSYDDASYIVKYQAGDDCKIEHQSYHAIFLAIGFGAEIKLKGASSYSYWSDRGVPDAPRYAANETIYLISGSGDGALIDLCAAVIQDFDHEKFIDLLIHFPGIEKLKPILKEIDLEAESYGAGFDFISAYDGRIKAEFQRLGIINRIAEIMRSRSKTIFNTRRLQILEQPTSTLNRLLVYSLILAGKETSRPIQHIVGTLSASIKNIPFYEINGNEIVADELIVRHGAGKAKAFEAFASIRDAYEMHHKVWLSNNAERRKPPSLNANAYRKIKESLLSSGIPVRFGPATQYLPNYRELSIAQEYVSNMKFLREAFSDRKKAALLLRQPLCPGDTNLKVGARIRSVLMDELSSSLNNLRGEKFIAVIGDEGCGKSWLVGQAWLALALPPLTLFITPEDLGTGAYSPLDLLSKKLSEIPASKALRHDAATWAERLLLWQSDRNGPSQGLLVVLDGVNQRPREDWAYIIGSLCQELSKFGGKLIITARAHYFSTHIRLGLVCEYAEINVPEWSTTERDQILSSADVDPHQLQGDVAQALCSPRLLGIALTLLSENELKTLNELSVSRLLFAHVHNSQRDGYGASPFEFKRRLVDRAKDIFRRLTTQQHDDLDVFDGGLKAVIDGRFFQPLAGDPTRYIINPDGLPLALGLAIVDDLRAAARNSHNLDDRLHVLTEPIAALDQTFGAMLAALTIACIDSETLDEIVVSILVGFSRLQNLEGNLFDSFASLTRIRPRSFLLAIEELSQLKIRVSNFDWLELSLLQVRSEVSARVEIEKFIRRWLSSVPYDIEHRIFTAGSSEEQIFEKREQYTAELNLKLSQLSVAEENLVQSLNRFPNHAVDELVRIAFNLLAGWPLKTFALDFVRFSFIVHLNASHHRPTEMFAQLLCFNPVDWSETREQLLISIEQLFGMSPSHTALRATVTLLCATGDPDDAGKADRYLNEFSGGRRKSETWRLVEKYCATDPCDPETIRPANVTNTIVEYGKVDVTKLSLTMGQTEDDFLFRQARAAVARFAPDVAIETHRALIDDVSCRTDVPLRQGIVYLLDNSALVTPVQAIHLSDLLGSAEVGKLAFRSLGEEETTWRIFQLEIIFPVLGPLDQLELLIQGDYQGSLSQRVIKMIKPLDTAAFESKLFTTLECGNPAEQHLVLLFSPFESESITSAVLNCLKTLLNSSSALVRAYTMRMVQISYDPVAVKFAFGNLPGHNSGSEWTCRLERWYASLLIIEALRLKCVRLVDVASRIEYVHIGRSASKLGREAAIYAGGLLDSLIQLCVGIKDVVGNLQITVRQSADSFSEPQYVSLSLRDGNVEPSNPSLGRFLDDTDDFDQVQQTLHSAYDRVETSLKHQNAGHILEQFSIGDFSEIVKESPALCRQWCEQLLHIENLERLSAVRNIGIFLASELTGSFPDEALALFRKLEPVRPLVQIRYGDERIDLVQILVWSAKRGQVLDCYREDRLDKAMNNEDISKEVFAALHGKNDEILVDYIESRLTSGLPVLRARAIYVAGLMPRNVVSDRVLSTYACVPGLLGETQEAAREVYRRSVWSTYWLSEMRSAESAEDFWKASVLFLKITDGRVAILRPVKEVSTIYLKHWASVERQLDNRFKNINDKRKKKLFGRDAPLRQFLRQHN